MTELQVCMQFMKLILISFKSSAPIEKYARHKMSKFHLNPLIIHFSRSILHNTILHIKPQEFELEDQWPHAQAWPPGLDLFHQSFETVLCGACKMFLHSFGREVFTAVTATRDRVMIFRNCLNWCVVVKDTCIMCDNLLSS